MSNLDFKDQSAVALEAMIEEGICPLCGEPVTDGNDVHKTCMDKEQYSNDAEPHDLASDEYDR